MFVLQRGEVVGSVDGLSNPAEFAALLNWTLCTAAAGLVLGRLILAPRADRAAAQAGLGMRAFSPGEDLGLFVLAIPFALSQLTLFIS